MVCDIVFFSGLGPSV